MRFPSTVGRIVERSARRTPSTVALTFEDRSWTYAELDLAVGRVAAGLLGLGLDKGDRVAAFGKNSDAYLLLFLGCARAGLVHVPVNFNARRSELEYLLTQSGPRAAFADAALSEFVDAEHRDLRATVLGWPPKASRTSRTASTTRTSSSCSTRAARPPSPRARCSPIARSCTSTSPASRRSR